MSITTQFPNTYSPLLIEAIKRAHDAVWSTLYAHMSSDRDESKELKILLTQTLIALAATGITDPQELRHRALETMALTP